MNTIDMFKDEKFDCLPNKDIASKV